MDNFIQLCKSLAITTLVFYTCQNKGKFIKCLDARGIFFFLDISEKDWIIPPEYNIQVLRVRLNVPIVEHSADAHETISLEEDKISETYSAIHLNSENTQYKRIYEQIVRLGSCFYKLQARILLERNHIICQLCARYNLQWYQLDVGTTHSAPVWYLCFDLSSFYQSSAQFSNRLSIIETKLKQIINNSQVKHADILTRRLSTRLFNTKIKEDQRLKQKLESTISTCIKEIHNLREKEAGLVQDKERADHLTQSAYDKQIQAVRTLILTKVAELQKASETLKIAYLKTEYLFHSLASTMALF